jgi:hypothetical protein
MAASIPSKKPTITEQRAVLGFTNTEELTSSQIHKAWRARTLKCHPDHCPNDDTATARFRALTQARDDVMHDLNGTSEEGAQYEDDGEEASDQWEDEIAQMFGRAGMARGEGGGPRVVFVNGRIHIVWGGGGGGGGGMGGMFGGGMFGGGGGGMFGGPPPPPKVKVEPILPVPRKTVEEKIVAAEEREAERIASLPRSERIEQLAQAKMKAEDAERERKGDTSRRPPPKVRLRAARAAVEAEIVKE